MLMTHFHEQFAIFTCGSVQLYTLRFNEATEEQWAVLCTAVSGYDSSKIKFHSSY